MNETEYLLTCLAEESAEVVQAATKALRFGADGICPDGQTNIARIIAELNDVLAVIDLLEYREVIKRGSIGDYDQIDEKKKKVLHYMKIARDNGTLQD